MLFENVDCGFDDLYVDFRQNRKKVLESRKIRPSPPPNRWYEKKADKGKILGIKTSRNVTG